MGTMDRAVAVPTDHPAVRAWRELQGGEIQPQSLKTLHEVEKSAVYLLESIGGRGPGVIAKRCLKETAATERVVYEEILPRLTVPTLRCYGLVASEGDFCWLFLDDAGEEEYSSAVDPCRLLAARWIGLMHVATASLSREFPLPDRGPRHYLETLRSTRGDVRDSLANPVLTTEDLGVLRAITAQCDLLESRWDQITAFCEEMPQTLVHGDFKEKNMRIRRGAGGDVLLPFDWEYAGWGTPAMDLARGFRHSADPNAAIATYLTVVRPVWPRLGLQDVQQLVSIGSVFRLIDSITWERVGVIYNHWPNADVARDCARWTVRQLNSYRTRMDDAIRAVQWSGEGF